MRAILVTLAVLVVAPASAQVPVIPTPTAPGPVVAPVVIAPQPGPTIVLGYSNTPVQADAYLYSAIPESVGTILTPPGIEAEIFASPTDAFAPLGTQLTAVPEVILPPNDPHPAPLPIAGLALPIASAPMVVVVAQPERVEVKATEQVERDQLPTLAPGAAPFVVPIARE